MSQGHHHLIRELLRAARRGEISQRDLAEVLRQQLEEICPECRVESLAERADEISLLTFRDPAGCLRRSSGLRGQAERAKIGHVSAAALVERLRSLSGAQRLLRVGNVPAPFAGPALCDLLLDEARACLPGDPASSAEWAKCAETVARL